MTRSRPITFLASAAVIPVAALAVAACGGGGAAATAAPAAAKTTTAAPPAAAKTTSAHGATVRVANSRLGRILVDSTGHTLYLFKADRGTKSACTGACATAWPPLLATAKPSVGAGLTASKLATTPRSGGSKQVTYNGHPLYLFIKDHKPGDVTGQGLKAFGAGWFVLSPAGQQISRQLSGHRSGSASSRPAAPAAPSAATTASQTTPAPTTTTAPRTTTAPPAAAPPAAKPAAPAHNGIPQNNGGDGDSDNNGGPSDGDGNI
jgi:predicted lipoprotein with Yx(FWY)xxD motif